jgi:hypothetical protein
MQTRDISKHHAASDLPGEKQILAVAIKNQILGVA